jgi:hypothetical protein
MGIIWQLAFNVIPICVVIREYQTMWVSASEAIIHAIGYFYETLDPRDLVAGSPKTPQCPRRQRMGRDHPLERLGPCIFA